MAFANQRRRREDLATRVRRRGRPPGFLLLLWGRGPWAPAAFPVAPRRRLTAERASPLPSSSAEDPRAPKTPAPRYLVSQPHPAWRRGPAPSFGSTSPRDLLTGSPEGFSARGRVWGFPGGRHVRREGTRRGSAGARLGTSPRPALARQHVCFISELPVFTRNQRGLRILLSGRSLGGGRRGRRLGRRRPRAWWRGARPPPGALAAVAGRERPEVPSSLLRRRPSLPRPPQAAPPPTTPAPPLPAAAQLLRRAEKSNTLEVNDRYYHKRGVAQGR